MKKIQRSWAERFLYYLEGISLKDLYGTNSQQTEDLYDAAFAELLMDAGFIE